MRITDTSDLWWKNAVVYCLDVETYMDWNDDGIGDLAGLAQRIDHLADLGVTCLWLMPFYPTADRDDGYDITDFYGVDPRLGTHGDLVEVIRTANDRGMRVIADLVVNHTSRKHPWFRRRESRKDSPYRDFYVWRADPPPDTTDQVVFPDQETASGRCRSRPASGTCTASTSTSPTSTSPTRRSATRSPRSWGSGCSSGCPGFRVDAVPFFLETGRRATAARCPTRTTTCGSCARSSAGARATAILLGEVNLPYEEQLQFFGGDGRRRADDAVRLHRHAEALPVAGPRRRRPAGRPRWSGRPTLHPDAQWATFVRNHDELTLDKLPRTSAQEVFAAFGPEDMQLYGRGLRRRLPPMLDGDPRRIRMVYSLLFSLPGTPVLFYGEEIGMGENLAAEGRLAVRTPMQWTSGRNGGFSPAAPRKLPGPVVRRRVRAGARQRRRPAPRPRLAAVVHEAAGPPLPRVARAGLGRVPGARPAAPGGAGAPVAPGTTARWSRCTTSGPSRARCRSSLEDCGRARTGWSTCCSRAARRCRTTGSVGAAAGGLRLPLAAGGQPGQPAARLSSGPASAATTSAGVATSASAAA